MVKKILFVCKYNRFRSKFAEAYFKKINKNKNIKIASAGIIEINKPLSSGEIKRNKYILNKFKISLNKKSRGINAKLLETQDKIIVTANDIPKIIFSHPNWKNKVSIWKIADEPKDDKKNINKSINSIKKKIDKLSKQLNKTGKH